jgi:autophagy-related protein 16
MLQDELRTLSLELHQVESRNDDLKRDNASLLQRWLDRARDEADKVNEANRYIEEVEKRRKGHSRESEE